eukprot:TRINITY_DN13481_c0_g1_i2.p1 TRINITY_DN13481_c0_g1~~TRINITY_DN13481_c0_g1_i2.p1  ORF type:complete len:539 (-),score=104.00 TRINITY_DN13481_c0_g1_i2:143-1552(-)
MFQTQSELGLRGKTLKYPRGKVLGGCSSINGMIYMRGQSRDYDRWAKLLGDDSFRWENVLPLFKKHEDHWNHSASSAIHGFGGEWRVDKPRVSWKILEEFLEASVQAGIPRTYDFNAGNNHGVGFFEVNQKDGWRLNSSRSFLSNPSKDLQIITNQFVTSLLFNKDDKFCTGVVTKEGSTYNLVDGGEVIISAGSIGTPHLLELSGIGQKNLLESVGIECFHELPQVGENLQDHLQLRCVYKVKGVETLNTLSRQLWPIISMGLRYLLWREGPLSMAPSQLGAFASTTGDEFPNVQYHVQPLSLSAFGEPLHDFDAITASVCHLNPSSRGSVHLVTSDPQVSPKIHLNYLSTEEDRLVAADAIRLTRKIVSMPALQKYGMEEFLPGLEHQSNEELALAAGDIGTTIFHPVGTCALGSVVDTTFRVKGLSGLRICDASVMPLITSGNTASPVLMLAEKCAQGLLTEQNKE